VISPPCAWQMRYNASGIEPIPRIDNPVEPRIIEALSAKFPDFVRAYEENGLTPEEFDTFGSTARTLRQFLAAGAELNSLIRDLMIPNPDR
jgi:transaldolase